MSAVRILIVDDNQLLRRSIVGLLQEGPLQVVCREASSSAEAIQAAKAARPDVVLLDLSLPDTSGFQTARAIRHELPQVSIIVLSAHDDRVLSETGRDIGASAWVDKGRIATDLLPVIRKVLSETDTD